MKKDRIKKKKPQGQNIMSASAMQGGHKETDKRPINVVSIPTATSGGR